MCYDLNSSAVPSKAFAHTVGTPLPPRLYRYRDTGQFTEKIFTKREVFFANPRSFNDPFDCGFHIVCRGERSQQVIASVAFNAAKKLHPEWSVRQAFDAAERVGASIAANHHDEASRQLGRSLAREYNEKAGVLCLAATCTEILMWSHYANNHRGICLEFRTDAKDSIFSNARPVKYSDEYPHLDLRNMVEDEQLRNATAWMLTKSTNWSYEREWRILDFKNGTGVRAFPPESLSAVILGCCIPDDESDKVLGWVRGFPTKVKVLQAKKSHTHFRLEMADSSEATSVGGLAGGWRC